MKPIISVQNVGKSYRLGQVHQHSTLREALVGRGRRLLGGSPASPPGSFWALREISFEVAPGEVVGIIGLNGAGKSTLLKILSEITAPTEGEIHLAGRVASLLEVGTGFHPELTGRENTFLNGAILGMSRNEIRSKFDEIVEFSGVEKFLDTPVKRYSSGMYVRLAFAVAAHLEPEILLVDEVLAVGDAGFQRKCLGKMRSVSQGGRTVLFVSHNMGAVRQLTQRCILLEQGRVTHIGPTEETLERYMVQLMPAKEARIDFAPTEDQADRPAAIRALTLLGPDEQPTSSFAMGRPWTLEAEIEPREPGVRLQASVVIRNGYGIGIHHLVCRDSGVDHYLVDSSCRLRVTIPDLKLYPGRYSVDYWLGTAGWRAETVEHRTGAISFEVDQGSAIRDGRPLSSAHAVVHEVADWGIQGDQIQVVGGI